MFSTAVRNRKSFATLFGASALALAAVAAPAVAGPHIPHFGGGGSGGFRPSMPSNFGANGFAQPKPFGGMHIPSPGNSHALGANSFGASTTPIKIPNTAFGQAGLHHATKPIQIPNTTFGSANNKFKGLNGNTSIAKNANAGPNGKNKNGQGQNGQANNGQGPNGKNKNGQNGQANNGQGQNGQGQNGSGSGGGQTAANVLGGIAQVLQSLAGLGGGGGGGGGGGDDGGGGGGGGGGGDPGAPSYDPTPAPTPAPTTDPVPTPAPTPALTSTDAPAGNTTALQITDFDRGPASLAGLQKGDIILRVDGTRTRTFEDLQNLLKASSGKSQVQYFNPDDAKIETRELAVQEGRIGVSVLEISVSLDESTPTTPTAAAETLSPPPGERSAIQLTEIGDGPVAKSGLKVGDVVLGVDGKWVTTQDEFTTALKASGEECKLVVYVAAEGKIDTRTMRVHDGGVKMSVKTVTVTIR